MHWNQILESLLSFNVIHWLTSSHLNLVLTSLSLVYLFSLFTLVLHCSENYTVDKIKSLFLLRRCCSWPTWTTNCLWLPLLLPPQFYLSPPRSLGKSSLKLSYNLALWKIRNSLKNISCQLELSEHLCITLWHKCVYTSCISIKHENINKRYVS